jgi:very-short-patch-repair endonuclease
VYPEHRVLVEYDGAVHFATEHQAFRDIDRLDRLMAAGWRVIRVNRSHLGTPSLIADRVAHALRSRGVPNG